MNNILQTQYSFELPFGYVDEQGNRHTKGIMRLACAADEILPMRDARVQNNPSYLTVIVLSRVITQLGTLEVINTGIVENLFTTDFNYLQAMYNRINQQETDNSDIACPKCYHKFKSGAVQLGEV